MKKLILIFALFIAATIVLPAQEYKVETTVESVVPMGIGRSRIIETTDSLNVDNFTTERSDGRKSRQKDISRSEAKTEKLNETKLLNFYSAVGINFQNIASNDAMITSKINKLVREGWELKFVLSGVESDAGKGDGTGIFITRYIFYRE